MFRSLLDNIYVLYMNSCLILELKYTKAVTLHCAKVGGGKDQGPTTQVTHLRLNHPFRFCSDAPNA